MQTVIQQDLQESLELKSLLVNDAAFIKNIETIARICIDTYKQGGKTIFAGNGGSAADSQHLAAELVGRFYLNRSALASIALTVDTSIITAVANDFGYDEIFARQIEALGNKNDVFFALSTSGNSVNLIKSLTLAKSQGLVTVGFTGDAGGKMKSLCDYIIAVPSKKTPRIQEVHITAGHIICNLIEKSLFT